MREKIEALLLDWEEEYWDIRETSPKEALKLGECIRGLLKLLGEESEDRANPLGLSASDIKEMQARDKPSNVNIDLPIDHNIARCIYPKDPVGEIYE